MVDSVIGFVPVLVISKCGAMAPSVAFRSRSASCTVRLTGGTQALERQTSGVRQSVLLAQVVLHALVPQM